MFWNLLFTGSAWAAIGTLLQQIVAVILNVLTGDTTPL